MNVWNDAVANPPPNGKEVLVYTEEGQMKVCIYSNKRWSTYLRVTHWMEKPEAPVKDDVAPEKKRGRPKK